MAAPCIPKFGCGASPALPDLCEGWTWRRRRPALAAIRRCQRPPLHFKDRMAQSTVVLNTVLGAACPAGGDPCCDEQRPHASAHVTRAEWSVFLRRCAQQVYHVGHFCSRGEAGRRFFCSSARCTGLHSAAFLGRGPETSNGQGLRIPLLLHGTGFQRRLGCGC